MLEGANKFNVIKAISCNKFVTTKKYLLKNPCVYKGFKKVAEKEGFEPPDLLQSTVFKTAAIDHSAISPINYNQYLIAGANIVSFSDYANTFLANFLINYFSLYNLFITLSLALKKLLKKYDLFYNTRTRCKHSWCSTKIKGFFKIHIIR